MTARRTLGTGPQAGIRAAEADLLPGLPGVRLPDLDDLRNRGVLDARPPAPPALPDGPRASAAAPGKDSLRAAQRSGSAALRAAT
ncbi:hypothetical protein ACE1SV_74230 [Streptomyces sp. E-15]